MTNEFEAMHSFRTFSEYEMWREERKMKEEMLENNKTSESTALFR